MKPNGIVEIREDWCKGCNVCAMVCPSGVLELDKFASKMQIKKPEKCIGCGQCEASCPDFCIYVFKPSEIKS